MGILKFPDGFLWGSSTSAYQVEGGIDNSDWSNVFPAFKACDNYNRYKQDIDLLSKLGHSVYRFSVEWSRIEPREGEWDAEAIGHYRNVLNGLRRENIKTMVALHHFTTPEWAAAKGGWASGKIVFYFSRFAQKLLKEYGELVDFWITINEPEIVALKGYLEGRWPPKKRNLILFWRVVQNQIAAHKKVYKIFHDQNKNVLVGISKNNIFFEPFDSKSLLDKASCGVASYLWNKYFLNRIKKHLDFIGLNYYFHKRIGFPFKIKNENKIISDIGWEIYPEGIYRALLDLKPYAKSVYITENGLADAQDGMRRDFIRDHLFWIHKAIQEGVDARGYLQWSLMDNFEWDKGFLPRFGLVEIDYGTMERKPRPSAHYYADICRKNALILEN